MGGKQKNLKHHFLSTWLIIHEAVRAFFRNDGLTASSSLAFYSTIAMIPALFLLTYLNRFSDSVSHLVILKTRTLLEEFIPATSPEVMERLLSVSAPGHALGFMNLGILLWSITPLISAIRRAFSNIFRTRSKHVFFKVKLLDIMLVTCFIFVYATVATSGVLLRLLPGGLISSYFFGFFDTLVPYLVLLLIITVSYLAFSPKTKLKYILAGSLTSTTLWFVMRPAFNLFLTFNAGFGLMFGSLKSIFIVVLWIYLSQCIFLFGAEVVASMRRREAVIIKKLMSGKHPGHLKTVRSLLINLPAGETIISEGEADTLEMYFIRNGNVGVHKAGVHVADIGPGTFIGEMSFLLHETRSATVRTTTDVELIRISHDNFNVLTREFPEIVEEILKEMATRLRTTTQIAI